MWFVLYLWTPTALAGRMKLLVKRTYFALVLSISWRSVSIEVDFTPDNIFRSRKVHSWLANPQQTSPEVRNRGVGGHSPTHICFQLWGFTGILYKIFVSHSIAVSIIVSFAETNKLIKLINKCRASYLVVFLVAPAQRVVACGKYTPSPVPTIFLGTTHPPKMR